MPSGIRMSQNIRPDAGRARRATACTWNVDGSGLAIMSAS